MHPTKTQIILRMRAVTSNFAIRMNLTLHPWLSIMRAVKIQIRLRECAVWSESSLGAHVRRYTFWHCGSNRLDSSFYYNILLNYTCYSQSDLVNWQLVTHWNKEISRIFLVEHIYWPMRLNNIYFSILADWHSKPNKRVRFDFLDTVLHRRIPQNTNSLSSDRHFR